MKQLKYIPMLICVFELHSASKILSAQKYFFIIQVKSYRSASSYWKCWSPSRIIWFTNKTYFWNRQIEFTWIDNLLSFISFYRRQPLSFSKRSKIGMFSKYFVVLVLLPANWIRLANRDKLTVKSEYERLKMFWRPIRFGYDWLKGGKRQHYWNRLWNGSLSFHLKRENWNRID